MTPTIPNALAPSHPTSDHPAVAADRDWPSQWAKMPVNTSLSGFADIFEAWNGGGLERPAVMDLIPHIEAWRVERAAPLEGEGLVQALMQHLDHAEK